MTKTAILMNWKTSAAGVVVIILGALQTFLGLKIPGWSMDFTSAVAAGVGLIFAQDAIHPPIPPAAPK